MSASKRGTTRGVAPRDVRKKETSPLDAQETDFELRGDHITLDALLKATGVAGSGGAAKGLIASGEVRVDGVVETRRGRKLRTGQTVEAGGLRIRVRTAGG